MMCVYVKTGLRFSAAILVPFVVSACGGGGSGGGGATEPAVVDPPTYTVIGNRSETQDTALVFLGTTNTGDLRFGNAGTLDHVANTIAGGRLAGATNNQRTTVTLAGGGVATLTNPVGADYMRVFNIQGAGEAIFGVVGQQSGPSAIPDSGSTRYRGRVDLTVADGGQTSQLNGDADITASWSSTATVNATFDGFQEGNTNVAGDITITGATISNSGFRGGTLSTSGALFDVTDSASIAGTRGYFFGPDADEVGGTLIIDDPSGSLEIVGVFSAN